MKDKEIKGDQVEMHPGTTMWTAQTYRPTTNDRDNSRNNDRGEDADEDLGDG